MRHRKLLALAAAGLLIIGGWAMPLLHAPLMTLAAAITGIPVARLAWSGLTGRQLTIPLLVTIAAAGALWIGEPWEAAAVTYLYMLGGYLEDLTLARTRAALRSLIDLRPRTARVKAGEAVQVVPAERVQPGQTVVVLPGDRVPVDGVVTGGRAALDTAALTGEPLPVL